MSSRSVEEAREAMLVCLDQLIRGARHSVAGARYGSGCDGEGRYPESHATDKDRLDAYYEVRRIFDGEPTHAQREGGAEVYLQGCLEKVWWFSEAVKAPVIAYAEEELGLRFVPPAGPSPVYIGLTRHLAEQYGVEVAEVERILPWEQYQRCAPGEAIDRFFRGLSERRD